MPAQGCWWPSVYTAPTMSAKNLYNALPLGIPTAQTKQFNFSQLIWMLAWTLRELIVCLMSRNLHCKSWIHCCLYLCGHGSLQELLEKLPDFGFWLRYLKRKYAYDIENYFSFVHTTTHFYAWEENSKPSEAETYYFVKSLLCLVNRIYFLKSWNHSVKKTYFVQ